MPFGSASLVVTVFYCNSFADSHVEQQQTVILLSFSGITGYFVVCCCILYEVRLVTTSSAKFRCFKKKNKLFTN